MVPELMTASLATRRERAGRPNNGFVGEGTHGAVEPVDQVTQRTRLFSEFGCVTKIQQQDHRRLF